MKFRRRSWDRFSKLGKGRKKKQLWRKPKGRDNKMREKRKGYPAVVSVGYRTEKESRGKINGKKPLLIYNLNDLKKANEENIIILGKIGKKKKIEVVKEIKKLGLETGNINIKKFLKKIDKETKKEKNPVETSKKEKPSKVNKTKDTK
jgi:large subunit ribosomal protein L32e